MSMMPSLMSGLVEYWPLHEASGTRFGALGKVDLSTAGAPTQVRGKVVYAVDLITETNYLTVADNAYVSMGDIDMFIACWIGFFPSGAGNQGLLTKWFGTASEYRIWLDLNAAIRIGFNVLGGATNTNVELPLAATSNFIFLCVYHDAVNDLIGIRYNMNAWTTAAHATGINDSDGNFRMGSGAANNGYEFQLCEVGMWKRILSNKEQAWLFNNDMGRTFPFDGRASPIALGRGHGQMVGKRRNRQVGIIV